MPTSERPKALNILSARHFDTLRRHPAVIRSNQAGDHRSDVIGKADATKGDHVRKGFVVGGRITHCATQEVGGNRAGSDGVRCDATGSKFFGQIEGKDFNCTFGCRVGRKSWIGYAGQAGGEVTIRPPSASKGRSAWVRKKTPLTWTLKRLSNCSSVVSAKGAISP